VMDQSLPALRDRVIPIRQAGDVLGVHRHTVRNWILRNPAIGIRIGVKYFIYRSALQQIVDGTPLEQIRLPSSPLNGWGDEDGRVSAQSGQQSERHCCQV